MCWLTVSTFSMGGPRDIPGDTVLGWGNGPSLWLAGATGFCVTIFAQEHENEMPLYCFLSIWMK